MELLWLLLLPWSSFRLWILKSRIARASLVWVNRARSFENKEQRKAGWVSCGPHTIDAVVWRWPQSKNHGDPDQKFSTTGCLSEPWGQGTDFERFSEYLERIAKSENHSLTAVREEGHGRVNILTFIKILTLLTAVTDSSTAVPYSGRTRHVSRRSFPQDSQLNLGPYLLKSPSPSNSHPSRDLNVSLYHCPIGHDPGNSKSSCFSSQGRGVAFALWQHGPRAW